MSQLTDTLAARSRVVVVGAGYSVAEVAAQGQLVTRAYHLYALPANRLRVAADWFINGIGYHQLVQLCLTASDSSGLTAAEETGIYYGTDGQLLSRRGQESTT